MGIVPAGVLNRLGIWHDVRPPLLDPLPPRMPDGLIPERDVEAFLQVDGGRSAIPVPVAHVAPWPAARLALRDELRPGSRARYGLGIYASAKPERWLGDEQLTVAIRSEQPLHLRMVDGDSLGAYLRAVVREAGVPPAQLRRADGGTGRRLDADERMAAAHAALRDRGYDAVVAPTFLRDPASPMRNTWFVGLDPDRVRVVVPDAQYDAIRASHVATTTVAGSIEERAAGPLLGRVRELRARLDEHRAALAEPPLAVMSDPAELRAAAADLVAGSARPVTATVRRMTDPVMRAAYAGRDQAARGADLLLVDPHHGWGPLGSLRGPGNWSGGDWRFFQQLQHAGVDVVHYDGRSSGEYLHGKVITGSDATGNEARALLRTSTDELEAGHQVNMGVLVAGRRAELFEQAVRASATADHGALRAIGSEARQHGVLVHDSRARVDFIRPEIADMVTSARAGDRLTIIEREIRSVPVARAVADAHRRGAVVDVSLGRINLASADVLLEAGVPFRVAAGYVHDRYEASVLAHLHRAGVHVEVRPVQVAGSARRYLEQVGVPFSDAPFPHLNVFHATTREADGSDRHSAILTSFHHFPNMAALKGSQELGIQLDGDAAVNLLAQAQRAVWPDPVPAPR